MKAIKINGEIKVFNRLPKTFQNILNFQKASPEQLEAIGFRDVVTPEYDERTHKLGLIYFDETNQIFTYPIEDRTDLPTLEEAKAAKLRELKNEVRDLYQTVQWYVEMKRADGKVIPKWVIDKIKLIKTRYEYVKTQINRLSNLSDVLKYELPHQAIQSMKEELEQID